ncbi:hypothetical protein GJAV_G00069670 [Gymnothorax javanicus]|nr:hypothetical protein GJAV_G00069670 [Gymnothorax javanicus]
MFRIWKNHWFIRKVVWWRAAASTAWSVLLLPVATASFVILTRASLLHPIQWISESINELSGSYVIFSLVILAVVVLLSGLFNLEYYCVVPSIPCTRIALLWKVLHPRQFVHSMAHCMMGMVMAWCASVMIGGRYKLIASPCTEDKGGTAFQLCLNEYHLFLMLAGGFVGYSYSLLGLVTNMNYVSFQVVQQFKYLRFKGALPLLIKYSAVESLYSLRNFYIFYLFLGYVPKAWICTAMNLHKESSVNALDTIYISEAYSLPVQSSFSEEASQCLPAVLSGGEPMILKFLAMQDLALLSQHSPSRRLEVFSLSQPGGHPHNWTAICKECLSLIDALTQRLVVYHEVVSSNGRARPLSASAGQKSTSSESSGSSGMEELSKTPFQSVKPQTTEVLSLRSSMTSLATPQAANLHMEPGSPFTSPAMKHQSGAQDPFSPWYGSVQSPHLMRRRPKLWTSSTGAPLNGGSPVSPVPVPIRTSVIHVPDILSQWLSNRQEQVKNFLAKRALVMYLFNKLPEASSQAIFADSQAHIWALEGLSRLIAASYTEDRYGVVQTTFSSILNSLLNLQEAVDKHFKLPHASSKPVRSSLNLEDTTYKTLRFALRAALKTAIYRITTTFGQHIFDVQMSAEHRKRLQQFMEYKE